MKQKWIFTGAAFALAMALNGCGDNAAANIPQQSSQEQAQDQSQMIRMEEAQEAADSPAAVPAQAQTSAPTTAQTVTGIGTVDEAAAQKIALEHAGVAAADATITESKLDYEDGRQVYDIEWYAGGAKYDYEIAAAGADVCAWAGAAAAESAASVCIPEACTFCSWLLISMTAPVSALTV